MHHIYLRVSTDQQAKAGGGLSAQEDGCVRWAESNQEEWSNDPETHDPGVKSQIHPYDRPGFGNLLKILKPGDCILVWRRDRICRDSLQLAILERDLNKQGIQIISASGVGNGTSPEDNLIKTILDAVSEYERALIRMRTKAEKQAKKERGEVYCRSVYGYKHVDGKMVEDLDEQRVIRHMKSMRDGYVPLREIARVLNQTDHKPPRGDKWHPNTIREILLREEEKSKES